MKRRFRKSSSKKNSTVKKLRLRSSKAKHKVNVIPVKSNWIRSSHLLPKSGSKAIVKITHPFNTVWIAVLEGGKWLSSNGTEVTVTWWMPFPKHPDKLM